MTRVAGPSRHSTADALYRGLGATLIDNLATTARTEGRPGLTLTTFRDVPWNAPYYQRLGFVIVDPAEQGPELAALVSRESTTIPSDAPRVAMQLFSRKATPGPGLLPRMETRSPL